MNYDIYATLQHSTNRPVHMKWTTDATGLRTASTLASMVEQAEDSNDPWSPGTLAITAVPTGTSHTTRLARELAALDVDNLMEVFMEVMSNHPDADYRGRAGIEDFVIGKYGITFYDAEDAL